MKNSILISAPSRVTLALRSEPLQRNLICSRQFLGEIFVFVVVGGGKNAPEIAFVLVLAKSFAHLEEISGSCARSANGAN
jgi:hypothetical protein